MKLFAKRKGGPKKRKAAPQADAVPDHKSVKVTKPSKEISQEEHEAFLSDIKEKCASATFNDLKLRQWMVKNCASLAIERPTPVQYVCIPKILQGQDVIAGSPTGSGKTAAFALPLMHKLSADPYGIFSLVLTPTRELAVQIAEQFTALGAPIRLKVCTIIGGCSILEQQNELRERPHIVVATPGRLMQHMIGPSPPKLNMLHAIVLDEADRLLDVDDFEQQLETVVQFVPKACQLLLFSATISKELETAFVKLKGLCGSKSKASMAQSRAVSKLPFVPGKEIPFGCGHVSDISICCCVAEMQVQVRL